MKKTQVTRIFHLFMCFLLFTVISPDGGCSLSMAAIQPIPSCPDTEQKLKEAVQKKRCDKLANVQNCTTPKDFTYHCVLNSWKTGTVEVCAPRILSQGHCIKFDEGGHRLQQLYKEYCVNFPVPCPNRFWSSELLKYIQCNDLHKDISTTLTPQVTTNENTYDLY
ncbi:uncharacterized protein LOC144620394 [Crassostrea virginica]